MSLLLSMQSKRGSACPGNHHQNPLRTRHQVIRMHVHPTHGPCTCGISQRPLKRSRHQVLNLWVPWENCVSGTKNLARDRGTSDGYKSGAGASLGLWIPRWVQDKMKVLLRNPRNKTEIDKQHRSSIHIDYLMQAVGVNGSSWNGDA